MEIFRALGVMAEAPCAQQAEIACALELPEPPDAVAYTNLFALQLYPYASVYLGEEGMLGGEARDRIAGFWRALHTVPPAEPDHLAVLLAAYANLCEEGTRHTDAAARLVWEHARKTLLWEHLLSWTPVFLTKLTEIAPPPYRAWGDVLWRVLLAEATSSGPLEDVPLHLRIAPAMADPRRDGAEAFLSSLLAPARSGIVLVRDDLLRAARELDLGLRHGERRFVLRALMSQDACASLAWLTREAERWVELHRAMPALLGDLRTFWLERAHATARLLAELQAGALDVNGWRASGT